ncbi:MAG: DUF4363 family protein [Firmicutes bacterium]|jgi:hypothetical protein|nr:DUF4363 family protein [Bacillota bacterium]
MKLWTVMFLIMVLIIGLGIYVEKLILETTNHMSADLDMVQEYIDEDHWEEALTITTHVQRQWTMVKHKWNPFIHNHELDNVESSLGRVVSYIGSRDKSSALAEISHIKIQLVQIHHQEILTFQNIF